MSENSVYFDEGRKYAEIAIGYGATSPSDSPLSGEFEGGPTVRKIAARHGHGEGTDDWQFKHEVIADEWEAGYFSAPWPYLDEDL